MAVRLVRSILEGGVFILSLVGTFGYISTGEDSLWRPVSALLMATIVTTTLAISHTYRAYGSVTAARQVRSLNPKNLITCPLTPSRG